MKQLRNKNIVVGVTGGIAAYKSADLVRRLKEAGAAVRVVMTQAAKEFITPLTLQAVSGNPVHEDLFDAKAEAAMGHIALARWADVILIAPTTADCLAKIAHGHANDLLTTLCLATEAHLAIAPAMNQQMWDDAVTQQNLQQLITRGIKIYGPASGSQACGDVGWGRMMEPIQLAEKLASLFTTGELADKNVLITAGPTQEPIDPVRYLTNHSSGKMGFALAEAAVAAGAQVTLIAGPVALATPEHVQRINVITALDMQQAVLTEAVRADIFVAAAAVADYRCINIAPRKLAKQQTTLELQLIPNPDIVTEVASLPAKPFTIGFAAETHDVVKRAKNKLNVKKLDMIVANQVGLTDSGFHSDENTATLLWVDGQHEFPKMSKPQLARQLITMIAERYHARNPS